MSNIYAKKLFEETKKDICCLKNTISNLSDRYSLHLSSEADYDSENPTSGLELPDSPTNGDTIIANFADGTAYLTYNGTDWVVDWFLTSGVSDGNGIYSGSGIIPTSVTAEVTDNFSFVKSNGDPLAVFTSASGARLYSNNQANQILVNNTGISMIGALDMGGYKISNVLDPTSAQDVVTKTYFDNIITGLTWKPEVDCATTANITLSGEQTIDGVLTSTSRVLVKNQSTATQNGIYLTGAGAWSRVSDASTGSSLARATVFVAGGTTYANTQWTCSNLTITLGSTNVTFVQISGAGTYTNGAGLGLSGNVFSVNTTQNISILSNLTSNGFIKTTGGTGTLTIDTNTYLTSSDLTPYLPLVGSTYTTTTGSGLALTTSTITSGTLVDLSSTGINNLTGAKILNITSSGANSNSSVTKYGVYSSVTNTGTSSTNVAGYFSASGGSNNYAILATGRVGIGTLTPNGALEVKCENNNTDGIRVLNSSGTLIAEYFQSAAGHGEMYVRNSSGVTQALISGVPVTSGTGSTFTNTTLTTGNLVTITSTSTALSSTTATGLNIAFSGANANSGVTATGLNISVANTNATSGTNIAATFSASGATTDNIALKVTAGQLVTSTNGALSAPAITATGTWITGGTVTTTKPYFLIETTGAASGGWNTSGTGLGINAASSFTGSLIDLQTNGISKIRVTNALFDVAGAGRFTSSIGGNAGASAFDQNGTGGASRFIFYDGSGVVKNLISANGVSYIQGGNVTIGSTTSISKLAIPVAPTATANYGTLSIGNGAFDGSTAGFFTGSSNGTQIAVNAGSGFAGDLINAQVAGANVFKVSNSDARIYNKLYFSQNSSGPNIYSFGATNGTPAIAGSNLELVAGAAGTSSSGGMFSLKLTTATTTANNATGLYIQHGYAAGSGNATFQPFRVDYTINNSGAVSGTATGIFLNATETALNSMTHNLMDLQVGGVSKFKVQNNGTLTSFNAIIAVSSVYSGSSFIFTGLSTIKSSTNGKINLTNQLGTDFTSLTLGLETSAFPMLKRNGTDLDVRLADDSAYTNIKAKDVSAYHLVGQSGAPSIAVGSDAGTGGAASISGTDMSGIITITTGTGSATGGTLFTLTFNTAYSVTPKTIMFYPASPNAADEFRNGTGIYIDTVSGGGTNVSTTAFIGSFYGTPTDGTVSKWYYMVIQ